MSHSDAVTQISVGASRLASAGGKQVCVWSESGALEWQADADKYEVTNVLAHSSGRVLTSGSFGTVSVFDSKGKALASSTDERNQPGRLFELADGRVLVGLDEYEDLRLVDTETAKLDPLEAQGEQSRALEIKQRGDEVQSLGPAAGIVRWSLATKAFLSRVMGPPGEALGFVGETLAVSITAKGCAIWQTADGSLAYEIAIADVRGGSASADGKRVAMRCKAGVVVLDVASDKQERLLAYGPFPRLTKFSADGSRLAVVFDQGQASTIALVDLATGSEAATWRGSQRVTALAFLGDALFFGRAGGGVERLAN
jgi:hypothetical protein